jgi:hypothetical protein
VVQSTQLTLLPISSPLGMPSRSKKHHTRHPHSQPSRPKKPKLELNYLAFDDDYFWELIRKDYASAWKYVDRMTRIL